ncbi:MAG: GDCCVxC domain-containing (seleno)protein [Gemmatimonadota bacterium]
MPAPILESRLLCPACGHEDIRQMPTDACVFFHECVGCETLLRPMAGHCCVFCSYGSVGCPSVQEGGGCCSPRSDVHELPHVAPTCA